VIKTLINPQTLATPRGYNHAVRAWPVGRLLFLSGQVGWTAEEQFVSKEVLGQFSQALANLQIAVKAGGGRMDDIVQMRIFVTDMAGYKKAKHDLGKVWNQFFGGYYPAMTLVEVKRLYDDDAKVEVDAIAVLPLPHDPDDRQMAEEFPDQHPAPKAAAPAPAKKPAAPPPKPKK
jgi:enamine deaminase RidA (YjgF/YER057c/UK114 family)